MAREARRRRAGGRAANMEKRSGVLFDQMSWRVPVNRDKPTEPLDEMGVQALHDGAMRVLEEIGIEFLNDEALELYREAGCTVEDRTVKMGRDWVMEMLGHAPSSFTLTPRNPDRTCLLYTSDAADD